MTRFSFKARLPYWLVACCIPHAGRAARALGN
jgi:hypothetical protein